MCSYWVLVYDEKQTHILWFQFGTTFLTFSGCSDFCLGQAFRSLLDLTQIYIYFSLKSPIFVFKTILVATHMVLLLYSMNQHNLYCGCRAKKYLKKCRWIKVRNWIIGIYTICAAVLAWEKRFHHIPSSSIQSTPIYLKRRAGPWKRDQGRGRNNFRVHQIGLDRVCF